MKKLNLLLQMLEGKIAHMNVINTSVSNSPVGWHIQHSLLTIHAIIDAVSRSKPESYKSSFSLLKILIFATGKIPRGRAKAPGIVTPKEEFTSEALNKSVENAKAKLLLLSKLHPGSNFDHPYFKKLNLKDTIRFIEIHTRHHINIMNDIINA